MVYKSCLIFVYVYVFASGPCNSVLAAEDQLTPLDRKEQAQVEALVGRGIERGEAEARVRYDAGKVWDINQFSNTRSLTYGEERKVRQLMKEQNMAQSEAEMRVRSSISENYVMRDWEQPAVKNSVRTQSSFLEKILGEDIFETGQPWFGSWVPHGTPSDPNYLDLGWSGYHIVMKKTENKRWVSYDCGDKCTAYLPDQCPDGDCRFNSHASVYRIGKESSSGGRRIPMETPIGFFKKYDAGSVEQTVIFNSQKIPIARFDEIEAQSKMKFDEAQNTTLIGFNRQGKAIQLGHIEEADAPWMYNQPESYYERVGSENKYRGTVVERIAINDEKGGEWLRYGTHWCNSPDFALTKDSLWRIFKNDKYDFSACKASGNFSSIPTGTAKQALTSRSNSDVYVSDLMGGMLYFKSESDLCGLGGFTLFTCNGTQYFAHVNGSGNSFMHINSERRAALGKYSKHGIYNQPVEKLITLNFRGKPKFDGIQTWREWKVNPNQSAVALIVVNKEEEMVAKNLKGEICPMVDGYLGSESFADPLTGKAFYSSMLDAYACRRFRTAVYHYYLLFPPTINGNKELSTYEKMALMDQALALMPDQTQTSPELSAAEEIGDFVMAIERYNATGSPEAAVNFSTIVDLATEEDSISAEGKVQDLLFDLGILKRQRPGRASYALPTPEEAKTTEDRGMGVNENEI